MKRRYGKNFWLLNAVQFIEKFAYWNLLIQMPVYLAQKDVSGGLHLSQTAKGTLFFVWALIQNLFPFFTGSYTDRIGKKRVMFLALGVIAIAYFLIANFQNVYVVAGALILLGFGVGAYKPAMHGAVAEELSEENSRTGWGYYFLILNISILLSSVVSQQLKNVSFELVFWGSFVIVVLNIIVLLAYKEKNASVRVQSDAIMSLEPLRDAIKVFSQRKHFLLILILSGFYFIYIQFYYTLPNFIVDWSSSSSFERSGLPLWTGASSDRGIIISYEWVYFFNSLLIIAFIGIITRIFRKMDALRVFQISLFLVSIGILLSGVGTFIWTLIVGVTVYTFGEMMLNPRLAGYFSELAPPDKKSMYMSFMNIPLAIGFTTGSIFGSRIFELLSEKATLSQKYLSENFGINNVELTEAFSVLADKLGLDSNSLTNMLWDKYFPYSSFIIYFGVGMVSLLCLMVYAQRFAKD